jgi:hypothetical protein
MADGIKQYRRKPVKPTDGLMAVAVYRPGEPLDDLLAVAAMGHCEAQLAEVQFGGSWVLLVRYIRYSDHGPSEPDYEHVEAGEYLEYSQYALGVTNDSDLKHFYDLVEDPQP